MLEESRRALGGPPVNIPRWGVAATERPTVIATQRRLVVRRRPDCSGPGLNDAVAGYRTLRCRQPPDRISGRVRESRHARAGKVSCRSFKEGKHPVSARLIYFPAEPDGITAGDRRRVDRHWTAFERPAISKKQGARGLLRISRKVSTDASSARRLISPSVFKTAILEDGRDRVTFLRLITIAGIRNASVTVSR